MKPMWTGTVVLRLSGKTPEECLAQLQRILADFPVPLLSVTLQEGYDWQEVDT